MNTYDPTDLDALGRRHRRLKDSLKEVVAALTPEVRAAAQAGMPYAEIARRTGYTPERVRQIASSEEKPPPKWGEPTPSRS
jgi:predicted transcriptional regulator